MRISPHVALLSDAVILGTMSNDAHIMRNSVAAMTYNDTHVVQNLEVGM